MSNNLESWSSCFSNVRCGKGHRVRKVACHDSLNLLVADSNCDQSSKPTTVERCFRVCDKHKNILRWRIGAWSSCIPLPSAKQRFCIGRYVPGMAHRNVSCILETTQRPVDDSACEHFWDRPESEMACSLDCPTHCVVTKRNVTCNLPHCPLTIALTKEVVDLYVAPTEGGTPCPEELNSPVCPVLSLQEGCGGGIRTNRKKYLLKIEEWSPCEVPEDNYVNQLQSEEEIQISLRPAIGISRRNITCVTADGDIIDLSFCNVAESPVLERQCVVTVHCLTSPWSEWRVKREGCISSDGTVFSEIRTRTRRLIQMPVGPGSTPCPQLYEERIILYDLPECYKYQWLPLQWSDCGVRLHGYHGEVKTVLPTCGSGLQYRNLICVRATDLNRLSSFPAIRGYMSSFHAEAHGVPVSEENCKEPRPPTIQRCKVLCRRDCQVSHWSRWGPCSFINKNFYAEKVLCSAKSRLLFLPSTPDSSVCFNEVGLKEGCTVSVDVKTTTEYTISVQRQRDKISKLGDFLGFFLKFVRICCLANFNEVV
ncbi:thrombospondin type-1 domain-containing protein 7A [Caerostris darwini]|uniref:Thrombospondin type-1 domain-containing protein 7A n=1 Tax=Caerostris darwini TaxID=1538125 RepID=A0AAV4TFQ8_9ARAC|nr:thrombospondin type-1 domain-containing protein 7A [Caerostris darwini]